MKNLSGSSVWVGLFAIFLSLSTFQAHAEYGCDSDSEVTCTATANDGWGTLIEGCGNGVQDALNHFQFDCESDGLHDCTSYNPSCSESLPN